MSPRRSRGAISVSAVSAMLLFVGFAGLTAARPLSPAQASGPRGFTGEGALPATLPTSSSEDDSAALNASFMAWYLKEAPTLHLPPLSSSAIDSLFALYLHDSTAGRVLLVAVTSEEQALYAAADHAAVEEFIANHFHVPAKDAIRAQFIVKGTPYVAEGQVSGLSEQFFVAQTASLPGPNDVGNWLMVTVDYYCVNLWLTSVCYGEHDDINTLYEGSNAQDAYNNMIAQGATWADVEAVILGVLAVAAAIAIPSLGMSVLAGAIIAAVLAGAGIALTLLQNQINSQLTELYESTYANEPSGNKYLWLFLSDFYYYPWVTLMGSLASSIGEYGYLSNGNPVTILGNYPLGVIDAASLSGEANSIGGSIGRNSWHYEGPLVLQVDGNTGTVFVKSWSMNKYSVSDGLWNDRVKIVYATSPSPPGLFSCGSCQGTFGQSGIFDATDTLHTGSSAFSFYIGAEDTSNGFWGNWVQVIIEP